MGILELVGLVALVAFLMAAFLTWAVWAAYARYFKGWLRAGWVLLGGGLLFLIGWALLGTIRLTGSAIQGFIHLYW